MKGYSKGFDPDLEPEEYEIHSGWRCQFCGHAYDQKDKPARCEECGEFEEFEETEFTPSGQEITWEMLEIVEEDPFVDQRIKERKEHNE